MASPLKFIGKGSFLKLQANMIDREFEWSTPLELGML